MKYVFLIGGFDLEMSEIKKMLVDNGFEFLDEDLVWGAKWSDYATYFSLPKYKSKTFVGIELSGKENKPKDAIDIDHHNHYWNNDSAIEQVAEMLNIDLTRKQKLIAANDRAYIQGMEMLCATKEKIDNIRQLDKEAQGVKIEDEEKAKESIAKHKEVIKGVTIIKSLSDKFSPITDLMYGKTSKLIVYNDTTLNYYGAITSDLLKEYSMEIENDKAYFGGVKEAGYFGLSKGSWTKEELETEKNKIITIMSKTNTEKIYSHHIFLFPFRWSNWNINKNALLDEKFKLKTFHDNLINNTDKWKRRKFELNHFDHYNEYNYFYDYVREVLYDLGDDLQTNHTKKNDEIINHFEYVVPNGKKIYYNVKVRGNTFVYHLEIDSVILNIYSTGTAVLSFHLRNHEYSNEEDVLKINKYGRRLYVPFFDLEADNIYNGLKDVTKSDKLLCSTKLYEISDAIWIGSKDKPEKCEKEKYKTFEDFEDYKCLDTFKNGPFVLPKFITGLFPENFFLVHEKQGYLDSELNTDYKIYLRPVLDDRMHTVSWYGNTELVNKLKLINTKNTIQRFPDNKAIVNKKEQNYYSYEKSDWWYNYIYADTSPMHTNRFEKQQLLHEQTYSRWVEHGTLYGLSRYSLVMLTGDFSEIPSYLVRHLQSMYYKMAELVLLQRATVLSYSDEVTHVSNLLDSDEDKLIDKIESLYKHYILFVNKIYFREITAQEQGIEMYDMMQKTMRIPQDVKDLDAEIEELNRFASMLQDNKERQESKRHTALATIFLPLMAIAGFFGMNTMPKVQEMRELSEYKSIFSPFWISIFIIVVISILFWISFKVWKYKKVRIGWLTLLLWAIFLPLLIWISTCKI